MVVKENPDSKKNCTSYSTASKRAVDVVNAYTEVKDCISDLDYLLNSSKNEFSKIYQQLVRMGIKLSITSSRATSPPKILKNTIEEQLPYLCLID